MSYFSVALGPETGDRHLGVTLTGRQPVVPARMSEDPARPPEFAPKHQLGM